VAISWEAAGLRPKRASASAMERATRQHISSGVSMTFPSRRER
jgi:hypothetical protein